MIRVLYIGQYSYGTTSKMRADALKKIINPDEFQIIDTNIPFFLCNVIFRSLGFRYKTGPLIKKINKYIISNLKSDYDLIWIDKAVFIKPEITLFLRSLTKYLIHFTPDPAFTFHKSKYFNDSIKYYDYAITTKSYEIKFYENYLDKNKIILFTQGFDKEVHKKYHDFKDKKIGVVFIGHYEKYRANLLQILIDKGINVSLVGIKWLQFVNKNKHKKNFNYIGNSLKGKDYAYAISEYAFSIGFISKWIPELHTTRTFEIPACGTALLTERNKEIDAFYSDDEVIKYSSIDELISKINYYSTNLYELETLTNKGNRKVLNGKFDYYSQLEQFVNERIKINIS